MPDQHSFYDLGRFLVALRRFMPGAILRVFINQSRFLALVEAYHFNQGASFVVDLEGATEISGLGFSVFNFTPFKFALVGASLKISLDSIDLLRFEQRFASEIPVEAHCRSGFHIQQELSEAARSRLQGYQSAFSTLRISGHVILRTPYGELKKDAAADVPLLFRRNRIARSG